MTNIERLQSMSVEEFADWFAEYSCNDPWSEWFDENYCKKCEPVIATAFGKESKFAYCELHEPGCEKTKCRFFEEQPTYVDMIKMWLEETGKEE